MPEDTAPAQPLEELKRESHRFSWAEYAEKLEQRCEDHDRIVSSLRERLESLKGSYDDMKRARTAALKERDNARGKRDAWRKCAEEAEQRADSLARRLEEVQAVVDRVREAARDHGSVGEGLNSEWVEKQFAALDTEDPPGGEGEQEAIDVVADFLAHWRYCPVSSAESPARSCLEDAAKQLLAALPTLQQSVPGLPDETRERLLEVIARRLYEVARGEHYSGVAIAPGGPESWEGRDETVRSSWRAEATRVLNLAESSGGETSV